MLIILGLLCWLLEMDQRGLTKEEAEALARHEKRRRQNMEQMRQIEESIKQEMIRSDRFLMAQMRQLQSFEVEPPMYIQTIEPWVEVPSC